jgi:hypothetical protein
MTTAAAENEEARPAQARPELRVLFCIARARMAPADTATLAGLLQADLDWNYLLQAAARHGVWPLLLHHLEPLPADCIPATVRETLREAVRGYSVHAQKHVGILHQLLEAFRASGLDLIPYKGPVLGARLFGDFALRQFSDLDLLVRREEAQAASACLQAQGFQPSLAAPPGWAAWYERARHEYSFHHPALDCYVELHWGAWPRSVAMPVDIHSFWECRETVLLDGKPVPSLQMAELLFLLSLHGTKHQWVRLAWLADIAELIRSTPGLDWTRVQALAAVSRSTRFLQIGLWLAQHLMAAPVPSAVLAQGSEDPQVERLARAMAVNLCGGSLSAPGETEHLRFLLRALPRLRDRLRFAWGVAVDPCHDDWACCPLPPACVGLYAAIRPARLGWVALRRRLAQRTS